MTADAAADGRAGTSAAISAEAGEAGLRLDRMLRAAFAGAVAHPAQAADRRRSCHPRRSRIARPVACGFGRAKISSYSSPKPRMRRPTATADRARYSFRGCTSDRHRQARRPRRPSRPGQPRRHPRQRADRPLRRQPRRHRRRATAGHRPSPRQGHQRPDRRRQDRGARTARCRAISRCAGSSAPMPPSSGACRRRPPARSPAISAAARSNRKKMAVVGEGRGRPALTRYRVERRFKAAAALVECRLATGRTHQIRVHLAHSGHPLIGDPVYGTRAGRAAARSGDVGRPDRRLSPAGAACPAARLHPPGERRAARRSTARCRPTCTQLMTDLERL